MIPIVDNVEQALNEAYMLLDEANAKLIEFESVRLESGYDISAIRATRSYHRYRNRVLDIQDRVYELELLARIGRLENENAALRRQLNG